MRAEDAANIVRPFDFDQDRREQLKRDARETGDDLPEVDWLFLAEAVDNAYPPMAERIMSAYENGDDCELGKAIREQIEIRRHEVALLED